MTIWKNCRTDLYYSDGKPDLDDPGYEVHITPDEIVVSYEGEVGLVTWKGQDLGGGHYELHCPEVQGQAMLHRSGDSEFLEGWWREGASHGMWGIRLIE